MKRYKPNKWGQIDLMDETEVDPKDPLAVRSIFIWGGMLILIVASIYSMVSR